MGSGYNVSEIRIWIRSKRFRKSDLDSVKTFPKVGSGSGKNVSEIRMWIRSKRFGNSDLDPVKTFPKFGSGSGQNVSESRIWIRSTKFLILNTGAICTVYIWTVIYCTVGKKIRNFRVKVLPNMLLIHSLLAGSKGTRVTDNGNLHFQKRMFFLPMVVVFTLTG